MKYFIACFFVGGAIAQNCAPNYSQCGGSGWTGASSCCNAGYSCQTQAGNPYYEQCLTATGSPSTTTPPPPPPTSTCAPSLSQCGGAGWTGASSCCDAGYSCQTQAGNSYYAQCLTGGAAAISTTTISTTSVTTTPVTNPTVVSYAGVNIAGFDFGCYDSCDSDCPNPEEPPLPSQNNGPNGPGQMNHFVTNDGMNAFRLPVRWEYLVDGVLNGDLSESQFQIYDQLVQACISSGAELCIIDLHNYAHWNNYLIGSGANAPSASSFANIWGQLASKYASDPQVAFGLMNEPHSGCNSDVIDFGTWDSILQGAVDAIRNAGATTQMIILPGSEWTHTIGYLNNDSSDLQMVLAITDPTDSTGAKLIVEVHEYLDANDSGCSADSCGTTDGTCVTDSVGTDNGRGGLQNFVDAMKEFGPGRKAMLTETGGNNDAEYGCAAYLCQELSFLNDNNDVFIGWIGWAAGSFNPNTSDQEVNLTPTYNSNSNTWTDVPLVTQCFSPCFTEGC